MSRRNKKDERLKTGAVVHWSRMRGKRVPVTCPLCNRTRNLGISGVYNRKGFTGRCLSCAKMKDIRTTDERLETGSVIYWSRAKRDRNRELIVPVRCGKCGKVRTVRDTVVLRSETGYCNRCTHLKRTEHIDRKGHITAEGYVKIYLPRDHPYRCMAPKGGRILEHRLIMAQHLGRPLTRREAVHHINGNKADNRIENLELCVKGKKPHPPGQRAKDIAGRTGWGAVADFVAELFTSYRN